MRISEMSSSPSQWPRGTLENYIFWNAGTAKELKRKRVRREGI
jgi:hypothetical protein